MDTILKSEYRCSLSTFSDDVTLSTELKQNIEYIESKLVIRGRITAHSQVTLVGNMSGHENTWCQYMVFYSWVVGARIRQLRRNSWKKKRIQRHLADKGGFNVWLMLEKPLQLTRKCSTVQRVTYGIPNFTFFFSTMRSQINPTDKDFNSLMSEPRILLNGCHSLLQTETSKLVLLIFYDK